MNCEKDLIWEIVKKIFEGIYPVVLIFVKVVGAMSETSKNIFQGIEALVIIIYHLFLIHLLLTLHYIWRQCKSILKKL